MTRRSAILALVLAFLAPSLACDVEVKEPWVAGYVRYQPLGPASVGGAKQARVSMEVVVENKSDGTSITLDRIEIDGNVVSNFDPKVIAPKAKFTFQNCNCDESVPLIISAPYPAQMTVTAFFVGLNPVSETVPVAGHWNQGGPLNFPAEATDLSPNESWGASSNHLSGHQVFALDMGVFGWNGSFFDWKYPGMDGTEKHHWRVYGKPLYAMADGVVCFGLNDHTEHEFIPESDEDPQPPATSSPTFGGFHGAGNHLFIQSGNEISLYAHMQPGSIPPELMTVGATVERGQYLGKAGHSGSSSGPHLHIHVKQQPPGGAIDDFENSNRCDWGRFRPMQFGDIASLTWEEANALMLADSLDPADWTGLSNHSVPHPVSLIHPTRTGTGHDRETTDDFTYLGVMREGSHIDIRVKAEGWTAFTDKWAQLSGDDFRLLEIETVEENGARQYIGVFERASDGHALVGHSSWEAFTESWADLSRDGLRLVDIDVYLDGGFEHYIGVFRKGGGGYALISHTGWDAFVAGWEDLSDRGLRLIDIDRFHVGGGQQQFIGVFRVGNDGHWLMSLNGWEAFTEEWARLSKLGLRLIDVETFPIGGSRQYVGVFRGGNDGHALFAVQGWDAFQSIVEQHNAWGLRLVDVHVQQQ